VARTEEALLEAAAQGPEAKEMLAAVLKNA